MDTVRQGILNACEKGETVQIFVRTEDLSIQFEGLTLDIIEALEQALIKKFRPDWNNHIQK